MMSADESEANVSENVNNMSKINLVIIGLIFLAVSLSCKSLMPGKSTDTSKGPAIDFTTPGKVLDVKVLLDKKQTASGKFTKAGGSVSLTAADGSKFTLDVPADALEADTMITMTAVKSIEGAPLDKNTPTAAVQLEPSGLFFKEMATLTIVPAKEIPIKEQVIFNYEGDGKDYHLALVDPKSKDIKIKLMEFSGAGVGGVGGAGDIAWAANLTIQAETARTRISQKLGEYLQGERRSMLLGDESSLFTGEFGETIRSALDQYEDQVIRKEEVAAELDCKRAFKAMQDLLVLTRQLGLLGFPLPSNLWERIGKLAKIAKECAKPFRVSGASNGVSFSGEICNMNKPFSLEATFPGGTATTSFAPGGEMSGSTTVSGGGGGCEHSGGGNYTFVLNNADGSGTLTWTTSDTIVCPWLNQSRTATFTLPLQLAPDLSCP